MEQIIARLMKAALDSGFSSSRPIIVSLNNADTGHKTIRFIVSEQEPHDVVVPLNVMWLVRNSGSQFFGKIVRRSSRSAANGLVHSWTEVTSVSGLYVTQIWDMPEPEHQSLYDHATLIGNPHKLTVEDLEKEAETGLVLKKPLTLQSSAAPYSMTEAIPRSFLETSLTPLRSLTNSLQMLFSNLNNQLTSVRNRTTTVETKVRALEERPTGTGVGGFTFVQEEPSVLWIIDHQLETPFISATVFEGNELVIPSSVRSVDENTTHIKFAVPVAGTALIFKV